MNGSEKLFTNTTLQAPQVGQCGESAMGWLLRWGRTEADQPIQAAGLSFELATRQTLELQLAAVRREVIPLGNRARRHAQQLGEGAGCAGVLDGVLGSHSAKTLADL